jgi:hypothetical protein
MLKQIEHHNQLLREQFHEHKNIFIVPIILVILALLRLIILFVSKCMKSTDHSWIFYFIYSTNAYIYYLYITINKNFIKVLQDIELLYKNI